MANLNISEAARTWGKSRQTIYTYLDDGRLTASQDNEGNPIIDTAEMIRVFGEPKSKTTKTGKDKVDTEVIELRQLVEIERLKRSHSEEINQRLEFSIKELQETVRNLRDQNERQGEQLKTALDTVSKSLEKSLPEPKKPLLEQLSSLWKK